MNTIQFLLVFICSEETHFPRFKIIISACWRPVLLFAGFAPVCLGWCRQPSLMKDGTLPFLTWKNSTPQLQSQGALQLPFLPTKYIPVSLGICLVLIILWLFGPHMARVIISLYPFTFMCLKQLKALPLCCNFCQNVLCGSQQNFKRCQTRANYRPRASKAQKM